MSMTETLSEPANVCEADLPIPRATILIVDDSPVDRRLASSIVNKAGFLAITAADGREALDAIARESPAAVVTDSAWRRRLNVPVPSVEGYLFPATYGFADGTTAREAVVEMLERFEAAWKSEWNDRLQALSISRHDAMTMASIVEKEARKPEERSIIAAVYWNRMKKGMRLQADPTVQYALPNHVERVLFKDLEIESKYNTYKYAGLPPGPIASPGEASIVAALNPANVPYLYFVAHPDGHHEFRTTFAEHARAIAAIKRERKSAPTPRPRPASPP